MSRTRELAVEMMVGSFMVAALIGLVLFTAVLSHRSWFGYERELRTRFDDVMGLRDGDKIMVRGMPVGKVKELRLVDGTNRQVEVVMDLDKPVELRADCTAEIALGSVFGGKYLKLSEGTASEPLLAEGALVRGVQTGDLLADASQMVRETREELLDGGILENFKQFSENIRSLTDRVREGKGDLGKLFAEDSRMYDDLAAVSASLRKITEQIENGKGLVGRAINDEKLYDEIRQLLEEGRATIDDLRETAPVVTFSSIFFGAF